ncbi:MAG TPA: hypothetical protein VGA53_01230 [Candidatus Paceibacterota bacterium]
MGKYCPIDPNGDWWNICCAVIFDKDEKKCPHCRKQGYFPQIFLAVQDILADQTKRVQIRSKYHNIFFPEPLAGENPYFAAATKFQRQPVEQLV